MKTGEVTLCVFAAAVSESSYRVRFSAHLRHRPDRQAGDSEREGQETRITANPRGTEAALNDVITRSEKEEEDSNQRSPGCH